MKRVARCFFSFSLSFIEDKRRRERRVEETDNLQSVVMLQMWPDLVQKSKEGGLDVIDTYVFWDLHEPVQNQVLSLCLFFSFFLPKLR